MDSPYTQIRTTSGYSSQYAPPSQILSTAGSHDSGYQTLENEITPIGRLVKNLRWTIKARVISKSRILMPGTPYSFWNIDLIDSSGEIRALGFERLLVNRFYEFHNMFTVNQVYLLSDIHIKDQYGNQPVSIRNGLELIFSVNTRVVPCEEIPQISYEFVKINEIESLFEGLKKRRAADQEKTVDLIGKCVTEGEILPLVEKEYTETTKNILLKDSTGSITVHLRGDVTSYDFLNQVVAIKRGFMTSFGEYITPSQSWFDGPETVILADSCIINPTIRETWELESINVDDNV